MITLAILLTLGLTLFSLGVVRAYRVLAPQTRRPFARSSVMHSLPGELVQGPAAPRLRADIVALRGQMRTRSVREAAAVWPATDFPDTEIAEIDRSPAPKTVRWAPLDRRDDVRLSLNF